MGDGVTKALNRVMLIIFVIGIAIGFILFVGVPWLWSILKPFIHMVTA